MVFFAFKPSRFLVSLVEKSFIVLSESPGSLHVVRENVKQDHRKNFRAAAHEELPQTVILTVIETEPGLKSATASSVTKAAKTETGLVVQVPPFINEGEKIKVDTSEGAYLSRA